MTVTSDVVTAAGVLTGAATVDTVRTGTASEKLSAHFRNYSGSPTTLAFFINGTSDEHRVFNEITLDTGESAVVEGALGTGDTLRAEAGAATSISYCVMVDILT